MIFRISFLSLIAVGFLWPLPVVAEPLVDLSASLFESNSPTEPFPPQFPDPTYQIFKRGWVYYPNTTTYIEPFEYGGAEILNGNFSRRDGELLERQAQCPNPGYIPVCSLYLLSPFSAPHSRQCSNRPGYCSAPGSFCCSNGDWSCPNGSTCCSTGYISRSIALWTLISLLQRLCSPRIYVL
jgi:hypothetical protein